MSEWFTKPIALAALLLVGIPSAAATGMVPVGRALEDRGVVELVGASGPVGANEPRSQESSAPSLTDAMGEIEVLSTGVVSVDEAVEAVPGLVSPVAGAVDDLLADVLECRLAVKVVFHGYEEHILDSRDRELAYFSERVIAHDVLRMVAQYVDEVASAVEVPGGILEEHVTRFTGHAMHASVEDLPRGIVVEVAWHEDYMVWEYVHRTAYVAVGAGIPVDELAIHEVVSVCDPDMYVMDEVPVDYEIESLAPFELVHAWGVPSDGWYVTGASARARFAEEGDDLRFDSELHSGFFLCPAAVIRDAERAISELRGTRTVVDPVQEQRRLELVPVAASVAEASGPNDDPIRPETITPQESANPIPAGGAIDVLLLAVLVALSLGGLVAARRIMR